jgi:hypothetical protein
MNSYDDNYLPDITDPRVFWPLVEELRKKGWTVTFATGIYFLSDDRAAKSHNFYGHETGIAVGLAYLKIKEASELDIDLPTAEDVLKMRGKIKEEGK